MEKLAIENKPKLIISGGSAYSREWDYARMRKIADEVGALLMIDMAHPAGLIAAGILENPVKYAHIPRHIMLQLRLQCLKLRFGIIIVTYLS